MRYLLQHGANVLMKRKDGTHALVAAVKEGSFTNVGLILKAAKNQDLSNMQLDECLIIAAENRRSKTIPWLITAGADPQSEINGETALTLSARNADVASTASLLENGADVDALNAIGETALTLVLKAKTMRFFDRYLIAELLLYMGATVLLVGPVSHHILKALLQDEDGTLDRSKLFAEEDSRQKSKGYERNDYEELLYLFII